MPTKLTIMGGMTLDWVYSPYVPPVKIVAPKPKPKSKHNKARALRFKAKHR